MNQAAKLQALMEKTRLSVVKVDQMPDRLDNLIARSCVSIWRRRFVKQYADLRAQSKALAYDSGTLAEDLFRRLCELDDFQGEDIRTLRKQAVLELKMRISTADKIRKACMRWAEFLEQRFSKCASESDVAVPVLKSEMADVGVSASKAEGEQHDDVEDIRIDQAEQPLQPPQQEVGSRPKLPGFERWRPACYQSEFPGGIQLLLELPGVHAEEVQIDRDGQSLSVTGVRLERGRPKIFREIFALPLRSDLNRARVAFEDGVLAITIPTRRVTPSRCSAFAHPSSLPFLSHHPFSSW